MISVGRYGMMTTVSFRAAGREEDNINGEGFEFVFEKESPRRRDSIAAVGLPLESSFKGGTWAIPPTEVAMSSERTVFFRGEVLYR